MIQQFMSRQFLVFLITGGFAAGVNFGSRILYSLWLDFSQAVILAYLTGMVTAFVLAKAFVFKDSQQAVHHSAMIFVLVNIVAILQTWGISLTLAHYVLPALGVKHSTLEIAHAVGVVVPVVTSYIGHKRWSFR